MLRFRNRLSCPVRLPGRGDLFGNLADVHRPDRGSRVEEHPLLKSLAAPASIEIKHAVAEEITVSPADGKVVRVDGGQMMNVVDILTLDKREKFV